MQIGILLADDHKMIRRGLLRLLTDVTDFKVLGEADNGRDAVRMAKELSPHVVIMDARMPDMDGIEATRQISNERPLVKVICLSAHSDRRTAGDMLDAGAAGYVLKDSALSELVDAIRAVMRNEVYLSPAVTQIVVGGYKETRSGGGPASTHPISSRELDVLRLVSEGKATKEVAMLLHISVKTAETHRRNLMEKLHLDSVAELTKYAVREGITTL